MVSEELMGIVPIKEQLGAFARFKIEKDLFERFGKEGLQIYILADGKRTAGDIAKECELDEERFSAILEFMEQRNIVKLKTVFEMDMEPR